MYYTVIFVKVCKLIFLVVILIQTHFVLIIIIFFIPEVVTKRVVLVVRRHPLIWSQFSFVHFGKHIPAHLTPKVPTGHTLLQNLPKTPGGQTVTKIKMKLNILAKKNNRFYTNFIFLFIKNLLFLVIISMHTCNSKHATKKIKIL